MDLTKYHSFHFIGIGGMGMRALAVILLDKGIAFPAPMWQTLPFCAISKKRRRDLYRA